MYPYLSQKTQGYYPKEMRQKMNVSSECKENTFIYAIRGARSDTVYVGKATSHGRVNYHKTKKDKSRASWICQVEPWTWHILKFGLWGKRVHEAENFWVHY